MNRRRNRPRGPASRAQEDRADEDERARIHQRMLEHLRRNPPPPDPDPDPAPPAATHRRPAPKTPPPSPPARPRLMLRRLRLAVALTSLESFVRLHRQQRTREIVVVVGRGRRSGEEGPVIGPAVRRWCQAHPAWVEDWRVAPPSEGGAGALVLTLHVDDDA